MKKVILILLFISAIAHADIIMERNIHQSKFSNFDQSFQIGYQYQNYKIDHNEKSNDSNFKALGSNINYGIHYLELGHMADIFSKKTISLSTHFSALIGGGSKNETQDDAAKDFYESHIKSYGVMAGASINYNIFFKQDKLQIKLGYFLSKFQNEMFLRYGARTQDTNTEITYNEELTQQQLAIGLSYFDLSKNITSYIFIKNSEYKTDSIDSEAKKQGQEIALTSDAGIKRDALSLNIGFGILF